MTGATVLILGSGGRETALAWKLASDPSVHQVWVLPGNPGVERMAKCSVVTGDVLLVAQRLEPDLVVVGPEQPLVDGIADRLRAIGIDVLGPSKAASLLEASKIASKQFMLSHGIPTPEACWYDGYSAALAGLERWDFSTDLVIKSDSLAGGKGVVVCESRMQAEQVLYDFMCNPAVTVQTQRVLFERRVHGRELSAFALCDGTQWRWLGTACDYKRVGDGDIGPNTGGMGVFTSLESLSSVHREQISSIFTRVLDGMNAQGTPYVGILFAGLMVNEDTVQVLEFNIRLGDPEAQAILPTIATPIYAHFKAAAQGRLSDMPDPFIHNGVAVHVVAASKGYPSIHAVPIESGKLISMPAGIEPSAHVFLAGVRQDSSGQLLSHGGRVLGVTAVADDLPTAREQAYRVLADIHFEGMHYRSDVAQLPWTTS